MSIPSDATFMGTEPVHKLLVRFALPAMATTFVNCLYNVVDRLYIGRYYDAADPIAGMGLTMPFMVILTACGMMIGQGSSAMVSLFLGERKYKEANQILGQSFAMFLLFIFTFQMIGLAFLDELLVLFGGTEAAIPYAKAYLEIILWGNIFQHISFGMGNLIRAEGNSITAMGVIVLGCVSNIFLDPIFIFWLDMGVKGAAVATVLSMAISSTWVLVHFINGRILTLKLKYIRLHNRLFWRVLAIGMAPFLMQCLGSLVMVIYNRGFQKFAETPAQATVSIGAFSILSAIIMLMLMPCFGINMALQPIIGYNTGAKLYKRVLHALRLSIWTATAICFAMAAVSFAFAQPFSALFCKDETLIETAAYGLKVACLGVGFIGVGIITGTYFQSIGRATVSIILGSLRQGLVLIPALLAFPAIWGIKGIWWAAPCSDIFAGILCAAVMWFEFNQLKRRMRETPLPEGTE